MEKKTQKEEKKKAAEKDLQEKKKKTRLKTRLKKEDKKTMKKIFVCAAMFSGYAKKKTGYIFPGMVSNSFYLIKKR